MEFITHNKTQLITTFNYSAIAIFYILQITRAQAKSFPVHRISCLVTASNNAYSSESGLKFYLSGGSLPTVKVRVRDKVTLRLTVSQSVSLGVAPHLGLMIDWQLRSCFCGVCSLWREDGSVFCISCWPLPAQSFSGPSPFGLATIFYCLRFETSLFVASYDSQGHGGGIRPRFHTS
jgi:hypothetical protein